MALAHYAALQAKKITKLYGNDVDALDLTGFDQVPEVRGLADMWWRRPGSYVAIFRGESLAFASVPGAKNTSYALVYEGLAEWV